MTATVESAAFGPDNRLATAHGGGTVRVAFQNYWVRHRDGTRELVRNGIPDTGYIGEATGTGPACQPASQPE